MIDNPRKVKDLIKNLAKGDSGKAQLLQRRYAMERFLERVAESDYKKNLVLKGGMLVTSMLDVGERMTRDADVTMQGKTLDVEGATCMVEEIAAIPLEDGTSFDIEDAHEIMEDSEYGGVRIMMRAHLGKTEIPMKIDISTGDALTPSAVSYAYRLLLEDRAIDVLAYNVETVLAEKIETMLVRSTLNSRMRDFYDMWVLSNVMADMDYALLARAIQATIENRGHDVSLESSSTVIDALEASDTLRANWENYRSKNSFASELTWDEALAAVRSLCEKAEKSRFAQ